MSSESQSKRRKTGLISTVSSSSSSTPQPMSAVAARRATLAASAPVSVTASSEASYSSSEEGNEASSSSSDAEELPAAKGDGGRRKGKERSTAAKSVRSKTAGRYFNGTEEDRENQVELVGVEEDEEMPLATTSKVKMGRGKRQRREKSAFLDPSCFSSFIPDLLVNTTAISWTNKSGEVSRGLLLRLNAGESIIAHGSFCLLPVFGSVSVLGAILSSTIDSDEIILSLPPPSAASHDIFAPSSHPLPVIVALDAPREAKATTIRLSDGQVIDISSASAVVLLSDLNVDIEGVEKVLRCGGLGCGNSMWSVEGTDSDRWGGQGWRLITVPTPSLTSLRSLESWNKTLDRFDMESTEENESEQSSARLTLIVEGPKRVGKSMFAKQLLNRLLSRYDRVAYLDTDLGQPEFTASGMLSLSVVDRPILGPSFTHLSIPVASHFLGSTSPASNPSSYLAAISALLSTYTHDVEYPLLNDRVRNRTTESSRKIRDRVPLIINTQGWVKGLGADLLMKLKQESNPTHLFLFESTPIDESNEGGWNEHGDIAMSAQNEVNNDCEVLKMESAPLSPLESKWSAADLRTLGYISYFHSLFPPLPLPSSTDRLLVNQLPVGWDFTAALITKRPYGINWTSGGNQVKSVYIIDQEVQYEHVLHALNGDIVAVVSEESQAGEEEAESLTSSSSTFPYSLDASLPSPTHSNCLGLAIIRSIDPSSHRLHLLTPIHPTRLDSPVSFVKGTAIELPISLVLDFNASESEVTNGVARVDWRDVPYLSVDNEGAGGRKKVRRNLMRRGQ